MASSRVLELVSRLRLPSRVARLVRRPPRWLPLTLLLCAIVVSYVFIVTAGHFTHWPLWNTTYDEMAEGFRAGHLYLLLQPKPELLAAPHPFDRAMMNYWYWDASLYKGHFYFYWGPLPAVILAGLKSALSWNFLVGDQYFVFAFYVIHLIAGTLLLVRMARHGFPELPRGLLVLGVLVFAYANPTPFIIATPGTYQAAIIGGQAFLLAGMVFAADALLAPADRRPPRRLLVAAGCCWGLGIATRASIVLPVPLIILLTAFLIARPERAGSLWLQRLRAMLWLGAPAGVFVVALLIYNRVRFDSYLEFGTGYMMTYLEFKSSLVNLLPNLYTYLVRPMVMSCRFPFLTAPFNLGLRAFPKGFPVPSNYLIDEPVAGLLLTTPWIWFLPVAGVFAFRSARSALRARSAGAPADPRAPITLWFLGSLAVAGTVAALPIIAIYSTTMRYLVDFSSGLLLLATWGAWSLYTSVRDRLWPRRVVTVAIVGVAIVTIMIGVLLGMSGYNDMFKNQNPPLFERMARAFSMCR
ncbi:MAG TPA: hypothetical protein VIF57_23955 [Polyangia bacterium]